MRHRNICNILPLKQLDHTSYLTWKLL